MGTVGQQGRLSQRDMCSIFHVPGASEVLRERDVCKKKGRKKKIHITSPSFFLEKTQDFCVWVDSGPQRTQDLTETGGPGPSSDSQAEPPPQQSCGALASSGPETGCKPQLRHLAVCSCGLSFPKRTTQVIRGPFPQGGTGPALCKGKFWKENHL